MATKTSKAQMLETLRGLVRDMLRLRHEGVGYGRFSRAHGYVDGYMRVLIDAGVATERELLELVGGERRQAAGPATEERSALDIAQVA